MTNIHCNSCHFEWDPGQEPIVGCPECGESSLSATFGENTSAPFDSMRAIGRSAANNKKVLDAKVKFAMTQEGPQARTNALIQQTVDKTVIPARYKKKVTLADGIVVKNVDGELTDQRLHGEQT